MQRLTTFLFLMLLGKIPAFCQQAGSEKYGMESNGGLCTATLEISTNKTFFLERGCEASSHVCFGTWKQVKDTINFFPIDNKKFKLVKQVASRRSESKYLSVKVFDSNGKNVTTQLELGQYVKGVGIYPLKPDSSNAAVYDFKRDGGLIMCSAFYNVFGRDIDITIGSFNDIEITLNFSEMWLMNNNVDWAGSEPFSFLKKKDKLLSLYPDQFVENGPPIRTQWLKEK